MRSTFVIVCGLAFFGCGSSSGDAAPDLAVPESADLGMSPDLLGSTFCDRLQARQNGGPRSDCAVEFFASLTSCFHPSGACVSDVPVFDTDRVCWADGAAVRHSKLLGAQVYQYKMNGVSCGSYNGPTGMMGYGSYCLSTATLPCDGGNDGGYPPSASYDNEFFTCADGTKVDIGPNLGTCAPLASLFGPISGCTSGSLAGCAYPP